MTLSPFCGHKGGGYSGTYKCLLFGERIIVTFGSMGITSGVIKSVFFLLLVTGSVFIRAQQGNIWYFGANAGLNFNTTPPTALTNGQTNGPDNTSTISDQNGNLLFYTNGIKVWNNTHAVMPNGSGLIGHTSAGQCALIVPVPCSASKYIIFHVTEFASPGYLSYTMVDMSLNGGLGDVVTSQKNVSLGSGWTEKLCAYYNSAGNNYWVLTHRWNSNQFVAFSVTSSGVATSSVVSSIGSIHNCGSYGSAHDAMGQLTISPDGTKVLNALTCQDKFELFHFNAVSGSLTNSISIIGTGGSAWGTAFSPDSKKIYTDAIFGQSIMQYDINNYTQTSILSSQYAVVTVSTGGYNFGHLELGPDHKLYIGKPGVSYVSVINNPNLAGAACSFSIMGPSLSTRSSNHGLSRIAYNTGGWSGGSVSIYGSPTNSLTCAGKPTTLTASGATSYTWSTSSFSSSIIVSPTVTTSYTLYGSGMGSCPSVSTSITITVAPLPVISIIASNTNLCAGQSILLTATGASSYTWTNGPASTVISVTPTASTSYTVTGINTQGCTNTAVKTINVSICEGLPNYQNPHLNIFPNPVADVLMIEINAQASFESFLILNSQGKMVLEIPSLQESENCRCVSINLSSLQKGLYFLKIQDKRRSTYYKIIKE